MLPGMSRCFEWEADKASAYIEHNLEPGSLALPLQTLKSVQNERGEKKLGAQTIDSTPVIQPLRSRSPYHSTGEMTAGMAHGANSACVAGVESGHRQRADTHAFWSCLTLTEE